MQQKWPHQYGAAPRNKADLLADSSAPSRDVGITQFASAMRPRQNSKRPVGHAARIYMKSYREHPLKYSRWRLNMPYAGLLAPRPVTRDVDTFRDCNGEILMPTHFPVGDWRLIEQDGADRESALPQDGFNEPADSGALGEVGDKGDIKEISDASIFTE